MDKVATTIESHEFLERVYRHPRCVPHLPKHFTLLRIPITFTIFDERAIDVIKITELIHEQLSGRFFLSMIDSPGVTQHNSYLLVGFEDTVEVTYFCLLLSGLNIQAEAA